MNTTQLALVSTLSLFIGLPMGVIGMLLWFKGVWPRIMKNIEQGQDLQGTVFFYALPGLLLMVACAVPAIYFGKQLSMQEYDCVGMVRDQLRRGITQDSAEFKERCSYFDRDELFARARGRP